MTNPRVVKESIIRGTFFIPMGLRLFQREEHPRAIEVSTVCLEGGHLEAPIPGMLDAEHGYETMVFFAGCSFFGLFDQHYDTREEALRGHDAIVQKLLARELPLAIRIQHYVASDEVPKHEQEAIGQKVSDDDQAR
jgi:hypothetical protein